MNSLHFSAYGSRADLHAQRICVVGAGASGLNMARVLRRRGYRHVTVLERADRVGGKCFTWERDGRRYELGAPGVSMSYKNVLPLMLAHGITPKPLITGLQLDLDHRKHSYVPPSMGARDWLGLGPQSALFGACMARHLPHVLRPGFARCPPSLHVPFVRWSRDNYMSSIRHLLETSFTGFGYGFLDEVPAVYALKWASLLTWTGSLLPVGYGGLWERVARRLDVRVNMEVRAVTREPGGVYVETAAGRERYDALVIASPLHEALRFLDAGEEERELIGRIRINPFYTVAAQVTGLPRARCMIVPSRMSRAGAGKPLCVFRHYADSDLLTFYSYAFEHDDAAVIEGVRETVERLGGVVEEVAYVRRWSYFPHVLSADFDAGFFPRLEALQGYNRTWYCGEILAFSTVETVMDYSDGLVKRCFA